MDGTNHAGQRLELSKYNHHYSEGRSDVKGVSIDSPNCPEQLQQAFARCKGTFQEIQDGYSKLSEHDKLAINEDYDFAMKKQIDKLNSEIRWYNDNRQSGEKGVKELEYQSALDLFNADMACQSDIDENTDKKLSKRDTDDNLDHCQIKESQEISSSLTRRQMERIVRRVAQCAALHLWTSQIGYSLADQSVGQQDGTDEHVSPHDRVSIAIAFEAIGLTLAFGASMAMGTHYEWIKNQQGKAWAIAEIGMTGLLGGAMAVGSPSLVNAPAWRHVLNAGLILSLIGAGGFTGAKLAECRRRRRENHVTDQLELENIGNNM